MHRFNSWILRCIISDQCSIKRTEYSAWLFVCSVRKLSHSAFLIALKLSLHHLYLPLQQYWHLICLNVMALSHWINILASSFDQRGQWHNCYEIQFQGDAFCQHHNLRLSSSCVCTEQLRANWKWEEFGSWMGRLNPEWQQCQDLCKHLELFQ